MKKIYFLCLMGAVIQTSQAELLITELVITPNNAEFIEIHNSGAISIDLTNVYLTDATFANGSVYYYNIVSGADYGGGGFSDFHARFPTGASIDPGSYQTIALDGSDNFLTAYGINPTYELYEDAGSPDGIADMLEAVSGSINGQGNLTDNSGEVVILYSWDGITDLVQDLDYVLWGDKAEAVDKTGVSIDGPDADAIATAYNNDTSIVSQAVISANAHASGSSWNRADLTEGNESNSGGNGITGHDETSENLNSTFYEDTPSPNLAGTPPPPTAPNIVINELDAVGSVEFIEIFDTGSGNTGLDGVTLIFYDGDSNLVYDIYGLTGETTDNDGYFLIGDSSLTPDVTLSANSLQDGADAIALYFSEASNFNIGDAIITTDLIDALVYDSGQADDSELLSLLNPGQNQVNEDSNAAASSESSARCANGAGGQLNTQTYRQVTPTPGVINNLCPIEDYYVNVNATDATTLRNSLHETIKVAISFPYSAGTTDTWDILGFADEDPLTDVDPMVAENVLMVYRNNSYVNINAGNPDYNREHTWPQSLGFPSPDNNAPRTDAHHLMLSDQTYNSARDNKYYDNCSTLPACVEFPTVDYNGQGGGSGVYPGNSNWTDDDRFEVWGFRKGDVARAMFYMDIRYEGIQVDSTGTVEPNLELTDNPADIGSGLPVMGLLSVLLQWHIDDPVDLIELERNEEVFGYQLNRNPFIDHPEWVACIYQDICPLANDVIFANGFE